MRAGGMSDSSKWKKQKRSPRAPRHMTKVIPGSEQPTSSGTTVSSNLSGEYLELLLLIRIGRRKAPTSLRNCVSEDQLTEALWSFCRDQKGKITGQVKL